MTTVYTFLNHFVKCHIGHPSITKCQSRAHNHFQRPKLFREIVEYISKCNVCAMHRDFKRMPIINFESPSRPWIVVGSDAFEFKGDLNLVIIDYCSSWIAAEPIGCHTSLAVVTGM